MMDSLKVLAMYLPQFHEVKENNEWWGEGFTDWIAVKSAKPLFEGHVQPRIPLNKYYYDLSKKESLEWQADLAKSYGVGGFVFYHYWFKDGKKILETPAEVLLKNRSIDMPYCFCWATAPWTRTWSRISGNAWSPTFDKIAKEKNNERYDGILLEQNFDQEEYWLEHIMYLLQFFRDDRYIKIDGCPVFCFTSTADINSAGAMIGVWNKVLSQEGLKRIYVVSGNIGKGDFEDAMYTRMRYAKKTIDDGKLTVQGYSYDEIWKENLGKIPSNDIKTIWYGVVDYDDTPRRGEYGSVYIGATPDKFKKYFALLVRKSIRDANPFLFIDAWNEWGEGMYLEPDTINGYGYLNAIRDVMNMDENELMRFTEEAKSLIDYDSEKEIRELQDSLNAYKRKYQLMKAWASERLYPGCLENYLVATQVTRIAIYGYGMHGKMLYDELNNSHIKIAYAIDRKKEKELYRDLQVYGLDAVFPRVDMIIVTVVEEYENIREYLEHKTKIPIKSLYELLNEALILYSV